MEFRGFYILALCVGLVLGFIVGAVFHNLRLRQYKRKVTKELKDKDNTINLWCKRVNKKKQVMGHAKAQIIADLKTLSYGIKEMLKKTNDRFKE